ncbi:phytanoyl-CoA dioxygenase family protein [Prochlorococcus marinus]|uniref:phytanoyl-CoA dioxygenase family protein n=1 Tax=Prochlorococcus marinus TaxID=1219 RepID=UPI0007B3B68A|nr:phytanoyl-CoA dioxygenase family protein [Prochlorococcus marinus]KZR73694.1 Phytanoyl-CoA dioxygenase (PhyH) [Prochlorococcus marinus str. MIT 1320]
MVDASFVVSEVKREGYFVAHDVIDFNSVKNLRTQIDKIIADHNKTIRQHSDLNMIHNCHELSLDFLRVYEHTLVDSVLSELLGHSYIIYAFQSSSLPPKGTNYARRIHVDCPRLIENYVTNVGVIIALDDFTSQTGAVRFMPYSHKEQALTSEDDFSAFSKDAKCKAGSIVFFNARTHHRAGLNSTKVYRHALTCNFCRCFMRQRFDLVRLAQASSLILELTKNQRKLIGYDVRMPINQEEFFQPLSKRMYLPNQE